MDQLISIFKIAVIVLLIVSNSIYLLRIKKLIAYLKKEHGDEWSRLGEFSLIENNSLRNAKTMYRYLKSKEYEKLSDPELSTLARKTLFSLYFGLFFAGPLLVAVVLFSFIQTFIM